MIATPVGTEPELPEMTGTGNAELWGFFPEASNARVVKIDKTTGAPATDVSGAVPRGHGAGYAFAFWGGDFWVFLIRSGETASNVYQVDGTTGAIKGTTTQLRAYDRRRRSLDMRSRGHLLAALVVIAIASLRGSPPPLPPVLADVPAPSAAAVADPPESIDELKRRIAAILDREHVPGMALALVDRDGPIWVGGIGVANVETGAPMTADTTFRVGSITKLFVVLGAMRLVEQGKLDLDAPVRIDAPIDNPWEAVAPVTLATLFEHTSGIDDMRAREFFTDDEDISVSDALAIEPRSRVVHRRPGSWMGYSNVGFSIAARAIELATGEPFDAYLQREVLRPMGITDAAFRRTSDVASRLATGYVQPGRAARYSPLAHRAAGGLLASANDLAKLVQLYLQRGGTIVSPASMARIEHNGTLPFPPTDAAYGLANYGDVGFAVKSRGHNGGLPGYSTDVRYFPAIGRGYAILMNSTFEGSWLVQTEIRDNVFAYLARGKTAPDPASAPAEPPGADFYTPRWDRRHLFGFIDGALIGWSAIADGAGVRLSPLHRGEPEDLVPAGDGGYRLPSESGSSIRFTTAADGTPVMMFYAMPTAAASSGYAHARYYALGVAAWLLGFAPMSSAVMLALAMLARRKVAADVLAWNAVAGLCFVGAPRLFFEAGMRDELGVCCPLTIAICAITIVFALASTAALFCALRWMVHPQRPPLLARLVPSLTALAAFGLTVWLAIHGMLGVRTWG